MWRSEVDARCFPQLLSELRMEANSLAEPIAPQFGPSSKPVCPREACLCLLRAVITGWPPGPYGFDVSSKGSGSGPMLEG